MYKDEHQCEVGAKGEGRNIPIHPQRTMNIQKDSPTSAATRPAGKV